MATLPAFGAAEATATPATPPTATAASIRTSLVPEDPNDARRYAQLESLFGPKVLVREFERFTTERAEPALFVLLVTGPSKTGMPPALSPVEEHSHCYDEDDPQYAPWMGCDIFGVSWLDATYSVALVIGGKVINTVELWLANEMLPLTGFHGTNYRLWGQGERYDQGDPRNAKVERVKLIKLADYNGDGHAWEFRLVQYMVSGHRYTILIGYSARQRKIIEYGEGDDLFPNPLAAAGATHLRTEISCGDHGNPTHTTEYFSYDPQKEDWVRTRVETHDCDAVDGNSDSPPVAWYRVQQAAASADGEAMLPV